MERATANALRIAGATAACVGALGVPGAGCAPRPATLDPDFPEDANAALHRAVAQEGSPLRKPKKPANALGVPLAVAIRKGTPTRLAAWDLAHGTRMWARELPAQTRPEIRDDIVVVRTADGITALDLRSGRRLWRSRERGCRYFGSASTDDVLVYVTGTCPPHEPIRRGHVTAVSRRSGDHLWRTDAPGALGAPAARDGLVFVPWNHGRIAVLNARTGRELARIRSPRVDWVHASSSGVHYGNRTTLSRLASRSTDREKPGPRRRPLTLPKLPTGSRPYRDAFAPMPAARSAQARIGLHVALDPPAADQPLPLRGGTIYYVYYRYVFAFDPEGELRWARTVDHDLTGAEVLEQGLLVVDEHGHARIFYRRTGGPRWETKLDDAPVTTVLDATGFAPGARASQGRSVRGALMRIASDPDQRLLPGRSLAVDLLVRRDAPSITRDLVELYADPRTPAPLKEKVRAGIRARPRGVRYLRQALQRRYDFLEGTRPPPFRAILPALVAQQVDEAVPALITHLWDPATPRDVLPALVRTLAELGGDSARTELLRFLVLYRADTAFASHPEPLIAAADVLLTQGSPEARARVERIAEDARTRGSLARGLDRLFEQKRRRKALRALAQARDTAHWAGRARHEETTRQRSPSLRHRVPHPPRPRFPEDGARKRGERTEPAGPVMPADPWWAAQEAHPDKPHVKPRETPWWKAGFRPEQAQSAGATSGEERPWWAPTQEGYSTPR